MSKNQEADSSLLTEKEITGIYKEHNWLCFEPDLSRSSVIAKAQHDKTAKNMPFSDAAYTGGFEKGFQAGYEEGEKAGRQSVIEEAKGSE